MARRLLLAGIAFHMLAIGGIFALKAAWFPGSVGCDDEGGPAGERCGRRLDAFAYVVWGEAGLMLASVLVLAALLVARRATSAGTP